MSGIAHRQLANTQVLTGALIPTCAPRPRLSLSQQRPILAGSPTATRPRTIVLLSLKMKFRILSWPIYSQVECPKRCLFNNVTYYSKNYMCPKGTCTYNPTKFYYTYEEAGCGKWCGFHKRFFFDPNFICPEGYCEFNPT